MPSSERLNLDVIASEGEVEDIYRDAFIPGANLRPNPPGQWLIDLSEAVARIQADVAFLVQRQIELPVILANNSAGCGGPLYDPRTAGGANDWKYLAPPNPRTRDELMAFTVAECEASARDLGLPELPENATEQQRQRQIGVRIGVTC